MQLLETPEELRRLSVAKLLAVQELLELLPFGDRHTLGEGRLEPVEGVDQRGREDKVPDFRGCLRR